MALMQCTIVCKDRMIYTGKVRVIIARGIEGEVGIYPNHIPFMTMLKAGPLQFVLEDGHEKIGFISGGFLEVQPQMVTVLADSFMHVNSVQEALNLAKNQSA